MKKLLVIFKFIILLLVIELIAIKLFPEYSKNQIYKNFNSKNNEKYIRIVKSRFHQFEYFKDLQVRSNLEEDLNFKKDNKTVWIFGDSVTNGFGLKYTDTYYSNLKKVIDINNLEYNVLAVSEYGNNLINVIDIIKKNQNIFKKQDFLVFQFNYNDILPAQYIKNNKMIVRSNPSALRNLVKKIDKFRFEYLHQSTFLRVLTHYASIFSRNTKGDCVERGIDALGQYTFSYGSENFLEQSNEAWDSFEKKLILLSEISKKNDLNFLVLISPISLQFKNHEKLNFHNFDLECSAIDGREKILEILEENRIVYADPYKLFMKTIEKDSKENNFDPLFFEYDTNHPNEKGSILMALSLSKSIINFNQN
tara:strand:- start:3165 stop:4259 length:1095 start_codon:yes stop_codon:yes gene_type:complete